MKRILALTLVSLSVVLFTACKKEEQLGSIYGVITDKATGEPVRSAGVQLNPLGTTAVTGNEGQFEFTELKAGDYTLQVTKTGYTDLLNYKIVVEAGKTTKVDVQITKLPSALRVVDGSGKDINVLDFGGEASVITRSFSIFNNSPESLYWIITNNCEWITALSNTTGTLPAGKQTPINLTIDRAKLSGGDNTYILNITSDNGSKGLTITAKGIGLPTLNVTATTDITATTATFNGTILDAGSPSYTERGFVYSTSSMPTIETTIKIVTASITSNAAYSAVATGLTLGQTYYVRAYAKNSVGTAYSSNEVSFEATYPPYIILQTEGLMVQITDLGVFDWSSAINNCNSSILSGYTDWRLPTKDELAILYNERNTIGGFVTISGTSSFYWSSTEYSEFSYYLAWIQRFSTGEQQNYSKTLSSRCRCVRTLP